MILLAGRDVARLDDGTVEVLDAVRGELGIDPSTGTVRRCDLDPGSSPSPELLDLPARRGWSAAIAAAFASDDRSLLRAVLDDVSGAFLVSGYAPLQAGLLNMTLEEGAQSADHQRDVCIGWAGDGAVVQLLRTTGINPVPYGPPVEPELLAESEWHPMDDLAPNAIRRVRRLDVTTTSDGGFAVEAHFRDTFRPDPSETSDPERGMHEYLVDATVDAEGHISEIAVQPRVLPWNSCPGAVGSAQRIVGAAIRELPDVARRELRGPTTCTHLTSTLRSLCDIDHLSARLGAT
ncbi:MAG TPA: DUF2889 domain-containing protein [Microthrixaceae bacterium]|nr:DUF2889 domain-containing protein [Microthrixaceae bacterium]